MSPLKVDILKVYTLGSEPLLLLGVSLELLCDDANSIPAGISMINSNLCTCKCIRIFMEQVQVMTLQNVSVFLVSPCRSWHSQFCFCPSLSRWGTNFAVLCLMFKCSVKIVSMCCLIGLLCYQHHYLYAIWSSWISGWTLSAFLAVSHDSR
jgi:hypothetical protein